MSIIVQHLLFQNNFASFFFDDLINNSKINHIYLNGNKAYELFIKKYPHLKNISTKLPSTSPANAKMKLEDLIKMWQIIKN